jgi:hypothetical protein
VDRLSSRQEASSRAGLGDLRDEPHGVRAQKQSHRWLGFVGDLHNRTRHLRGVAALHVRVLAVGAREHADRRVIVLVQVRVG